MQINNLERSLSGSSDARFEAIGQLDRAGCKAAWQRRFGAPPCKHLSVAFMQRVLLWEAQGSVFGLVPKSTKRKIAAAANGKATSKASKTQPGDVLVREWNGRTYRVEVTTSGYVMDGKPWRSLTALAKHITGAHWSGPRFFGVA